MAFVVSNKRGSFEVRESRSTPQGPRSRTLATFVELDEGTIRKAIARATGDLDPGRLRQAALRAGAAVAPAPADAAARDLLRRLHRGEGPGPLLRRLLLDGLRPRAGAAAGAEPLNQVSDAARSAAAWVGTSSRERGEALRDLLGLADALPLDIRSEAIDFPHLDSGGHP